MAVIASAVDIAVGEVRVRRPRGWPL